VWLSWDMASLLAAGLAAFGWVTRRRGQRWRLVSDVAVEASLVAVLYSIWQLIGTFTDRRVTGAEQHGLWVWNLERAMHLPSELSAQRQLLPHPLLVQAANGFYAIVHVPALGVFLVWLFLRHRDRYPAWRNVLAVLTFGCFVAHLVPVAPPRLIHGLGFVDTGALYHQSVYGPMGTGISDQLSAMPSVHLAWACLIALATIQAGTSRWRWAVVLHPLATLYVVTVTGNHFILDGVAAAVVLGLSVVLVRLPSLLRPAPAQASPSLAAGTVASRPAR